jgi:hypothetical protein
VEGRMGARSNFIKSSKWLFIMAEIITHGETILPLSKFASSLFTKKLDIFPFSISKVIWLTYFSYSSNSIKSLSGGVLMKLHHQIAGFSDEREGFLRI